MKKETKKAIVINENTKLFTLAGPVFVEVLLSMLIGNIDVVMLSRYSSNAVGSVSNANQIINLFVLMFSIISSASGVIIAQYMGANRKEKISEIYSLAMFINVLISVVVGIVIMVFAKGMFHLIHTDKVFMDDAVLYIRYIGGFIFLQAVFNTFAIIFKSNGMMKVSMYVSLIVNLVNIIGNYTFLYGSLKFLNLGVQGVAISSVLSRAIAVVVMIAIFIQKVHGSISIKYLFPFPKKMFYKMLTIGIPSAGESISYNISQIFILMIINIIGRDAVNAKACAAVLCSFAYVFAQASAQGTQLIVGYLVGADKYDEAYKRVLKSLTPAIVVSVLIAVIIYLLSPLGIKLFDLNSSATKLVGTVIAVDIFLEVGRATNLVVIQSMRSAGDVVFPTVLGMISMWGISVGVGAILGLGAGLGLVGVWIAMAFDEWFRAVVVYIRWRKGNWRGKSVVS